MTRIEAHGVGFGLENEAGIFLTSNYSVVETHRGSDVTLNCRVKRGSDFGTVRGIILINLRFFIFLWTWSWNRICTALSSSSVKHNYIFNISFSLFYTLSFHLNSLHKLIFSSLVEKAHKIETLLKHHSPLLLSLFQISWFRRSEAGGVVLISVGDDVYISDGRFALVRPVLSMVSETEQFSIEQWEIMWQ